MLDAEGMHIIATEIVKVAKSVRWLELPDIPEKGDFLRLDKD